MHVQVSLKINLFCGVLMAFGVKPNANMALVVVAFPGMLPVINKFCMEQSEHTDIDLNTKNNTH